MRRRKREGGEGGGEAEGAVHLSGSSNEWLRCPSSHVNESQDERPVTSSPPKTGHMANHDSQPVTGRCDSVSVQDGGTASFCTSAPSSRARLLGGKDRKTESCAGPQHAPFNLRHAPSNPPPAPSNPPSAPWRHRKGSSAVAVFACSNSASTRAIVGAREALHHRDCLRTPRPTTDAVQGLEQSTKSDILLAPYHRNHFGGRPATDAPHVAPDATLSMRQDAHGSNGSAANDLVTRRPPTQHHHIPLAPLLFAFACCPICPVPARFNHHPRQSPSVPMSW
jgi:hypothetical protein